MRVAILSEIAFDKSEESAYITILDLARQLAKEGNKITVIGRWKKGLKTQSNINGVNLIRTKPIIGSKLLGNFIGPLKIIKSMKRVDIVHNFSAAPASGIKTYLIKKFNKNIKTVNTLKSYSRKPSLRFSFLHFLSNADKVTVPTEIFKNKLVARGVTGSKIEVVHTSLDLQKFKPRSKIALKKKYGFANKKIVLYYGALWKQKGVQHLVNALPTIFREHKDAVFIFAPRHLYVNVGTLKKAVGFENTVLVKRMKSVSDYVNMADVVVLPYENLVATEGNPSCLLESMACKTPVVTSKLPELEELVKNNKDVLMVPAANSKALADRINKILSDKKLAQRLTSSAHQKVKQFALEKITKRYIKLYNKL